MSHDDKRASVDLPVVPAEPGSDEQLPPLAARPATGAPDALGFHLRFEAGRALLALEGSTLVPGVTIHRALFEVPDVAFPLDVTGGAHRFQDKLLTLRGVEIDVDAAHVLDPASLKRAGLHLLRSRTRQGALEVLFEVQGPGGPVGVRARIHIVPAGNAGVAFVVDGLTGFGPLPHTRLTLSEALLTALQVPGGYPPRGMVRRAEVFRAIFARLLPSYGWKVPALGEVRVHEAMLQKSTLSLRAFAGDLPDGWKRPRQPKRSHIDDAVALAVFADTFAGAESDDARMAIVDRFVDGGAVSKAVVPFLAEVLRRSPRRKSEAERLIHDALASAPDDIALLSSAIDDPTIDDETRIARLARLGEAAEEQAEPWVSAQAYHAAAVRALDLGRRENALGLAENAFAADPTLGDTARLLARLLSSSGRDDEALKIGRQALERLEDQGEIEAFSAELAPMALRIEGIDAARQLLARALRRSDRHDALSALVDLEAEAGDLERAAELLARLLVLDETRADRKKARDVHVLAARISARRGDIVSARAHLGDAESLAPGDVDVAIARAHLEESVGNLDRAIEALLPMVDVDAPALDVVNLLIRVLASRHHADDARVARELLDRTALAPPTAMRARIEAEVRALEGDSLPLALLLDEEARAAQVGARGGAFLLAGTRFLEAGERARAVAALASAVDDGVSVAALAELSLKHDALAVARAFADAPESVVSTTLRRELARTFAASGVPEAAAHTVLGLTDVDDLRARVAYATDSGDAALSIAALETLREALPEASDSNEIQSVSVRLGELLLASDDDVGSAERAASLFDEAYASGADVAVPWLKAALRTGDPAQLARFFVATDVSPADVPTAALRALRDEASSDLDARPGKLLEVVHALADRRESIDDAEAYLRILDDTATVRTRAAERIRVGREHTQPAWIAEGVALLVDDGAAALALELTAVGEGEIVDDAVVLQARFAAAVMAEALDDIDQTATKLLETLPHEAHHARVAIHAQRVRALGISVDERVPDAAALHALSPDRRGRLRLAIGGWLDEEPAAAVLGYGVFLALADDDVTGAMERLLAAVAHGLDDERHATLATEVAAAFRDRNDDNHEVVVRQTLLGHPDRDVAMAAADRVAALLEANGRLDEARAVYLRRAQLGGERGAIADAWRAVARLTTENPEGAAEALAHVLELDPLDDEASITRLALLEQIEDWASFADLLASRVSRIGEGPERTAAIVRLGVVYDEKLKDVRRAAKAWLQATRSRPFSEVPLKKLLALAERENDLKIRVRAHIAAARAIFDGDARARHAIEAGALLAGMLMRPNLAVPLFERAAGDAADKRPALRALIEIYRAVDDGVRALDAAERFTATYPDQERALGLEIQADIHERNLGDRVRAADLRRLALTLDPALRVSGLALTTFLRTEGRMREAIEVRRQLAEASESPAQRAQTYVYLADLAESDLDDKALMIELATAALDVDPHLRSMRARIVDAHLTIGQVRPACDEIGALLAADDLTADECTALARRKATLEFIELSDPTAARETLMKALARVGDSDLLLALLVDVMAQLELYIEAAEVLEGVLARHEDGLRDLGSRREILERAAMLREDGNDSTGAMDLLDEAAALGKLSRPSELRRARLAEQLDRPGDAVASLLVLFADRTADVDETVALAGRLGTAAERAGRYDVAIKAWSERVERVRGDIEAERTLERLALEHGAPEAARRAADALLFAEVGDDDERRARLIFVAEDALSRTDEPQRALHAILAARALRDDVELITLGIRAARALDDNEAELAFMDDLSVARGSLDGTDLLRRAELAIASAPARALSDLIALAGTQPTLDGAAHALFVKAVERAPNAAASALADLLSDGRDLPIVGSLREALVDLSTLDDESLERLSACLPRDIALGRTASARASSAGQHGAAVDRLLALASELRHVDAVSAEELSFEAAREAVAAGASVLVARVDALAEIIARDPALRADGLHTLRDAEAWAGTARLLEAMLDVIDGPEARQLRFELALILRAELEDPRRAARVLESLLDDDESDREVWGEILECLDEASDEVELARMLGRRLRSATGFERRELSKRRAHILMKLGQHAEAFADLALARTDARDDDALKALHITVAEALGPQHLADVLVDELLSSGSLRDAEAVLACPKGLVEDLALARAAALVLEHDGLAGSAVAKRILEESPDVASSVLLNVAARRTGDARTTWLNAVLGAFLRVDNTSDDGQRAVAAQVLTQVVDSESIESTAALLALDVAWLARRAGPRIALERLRTLLSRRTDAKAFAPLETKLLSRCGETRAAISTARELGLESHAMLSSANEVGVRAREAIRQAARAGHALTAAIRVGDATGAMAAWHTSSASDRGALHASVRTLRSTPERLSIRHAISADLPDALRALESRSLARTARDCADLTREAALLDAIAESGTLESAEVERRAVLALELDAADAEHHLERAALLGDPATIVAHRRSIVHLHLRRGSPLDNVARALEALVHAAPADAALVDEALDIAHAVRLDDMVDDLFGEAVARANDDESRRRLQARRVEHRLKVGRDARGAFQLLFADEGQREAAYVLAVREALVEEQAEVVDDALARAALLWLLGNRSEALACVKDGESPAFFLLSAEIARARSDVAGETAALQRIEALGCADAAVLLRLAELTAAVSASDAALRLVAVLNGMPSQSSATRARTHLSALVTRPEIAIGVIIEALGATLAAQAHDRETWPMRHAMADAALLQGVDATAVIAPIVKDGGDDVVDTLYLEHLLAHRRADDVGGELLSLGIRPAVLSLCTRRPVDVQRVLVTLLPSSAGFVITLLRALGGDVPLSSSLAWLLVDALEQEHRLEEATEVLASIVDDSASAGHLRRMRSATLELRRGAVEDAARLLEEVARGDLDDATRAQAQILAGRIGPRALPALLQLLQNRVVDESAFSHVLDLAERAAPRLAVAAATWVLDRRRGHRRAIDVVRDHADDAARRFFVGQSLLRAPSDAPEIYVVNHENVAISDSVVQALTLRGRGPAFAAAVPPSASGASLLARARHSDDLGDRRSAWAALAREAADADQSVIAARYLSRAHMSLEDAPIEIRLAADKALADPSARADAIAAALGDEGRPSGSRADLLVALQRLEDQGFLGARHRSVLFDADDDAPHVDLVTLGQVDALRARLVALGRHPRAGERSALAVAFAAVGETRIARFVHPGVTRVARVGVARVEFSDALLPSSEPERKNAARVAVGQSLIALLTTGTTPAREQEIRMLARAAEREDIVAASFARSAAIAGDPALRAALGVERAAHALRVLDDARVARVVARHVAVDEGDVPKALRRDAAEMWADAALADHDVDDARVALAHLETLVEGADDRVRVVARRADLAIGAGDAATALSMLDEARVGLTERDRGLAILFEARGRALLALGRVVEASAAFLEASRDAMLASDEKVRLANHASALAHDAGDDEAAVRALLSIVDADEASLARAEELARASSSIRALVEVLDVSIARESSPTRLRALVLERACLLYDALDDKKGAIEALEAQAIADEGDYAARLRLAAWYLVDKRLLDAALAFESATVIADIPSDVCAHAAREAAALLSSLGDLERATPLAERALGLGVKDRAVLQIIGASHREQERYEALDDVLEIEQSITEDARARASIWLERASIRRDALDDVAGARKAMHSALELAPVHPGALMLMRTDAEATGSFGALRAALSRAAELTDDDAARVGWLIEIASLDEERFQDLRAAEATIDRALEVVGQDASLLVRKALLLAKAGRLDGLPAVLDAAERAGARELPGTLEIVRGDALLIVGDRAGATRAFEVATRDAESRDKAWDRLIDLAEISQDDATMAVRLSFARAGTEDPVRRAALSRREARIRLRVGDEDGAMAAFETVLENDPADSESLRALQEIYTRRRRADKIDPLMERWALAAEEPSERARRLAEYGSYLVDQLGAEARGRSAFEAALEQDSNEHTALTRLAAIFSAANQHRRALELLDRIDVADWNEGPRDILFRRAVAAHALQADDAISRFQAVLDVEPQHIPSLEAQVEIAERMGNRRMLREALVSLAAAVDERTDPVRLAKALTELARVLVDEGSPEEALRIAAQAFELRPNALATLDVYADAHALSGQYAEGAGLLRRLEALVAAPERASVIERRASMHEKAGELALALEALLELQTLTDDARVTAKVDALRAQIVAESIVDATVKLPVARADRPRAVTGIEAGFDAVAVTALTPEKTLEATGPREDMTSPGFNALSRQVEIMIDEGRFDEAMALLHEAYSTGSADAEHAQFGIRAARASRNARELVFFVEQRLRGASDQEEVKALALEAGRALRDVLSEHERAADLLYLAHQAAPDDIDVRLELTELYARIPRLLGHAQTGVLQLLRRSPGNARACRIAAVVAERQHIAEKRTAMLAIAEILSGHARAFEVQEQVPFAPVAGRRSLDEAMLKTRLAPEGFASDLDVVLSAIERELETIFATDATALVDARRLSEVSPTALALFERVDRVLPGRPMKLLVGPNRHTIVHAGSTLHIVLPGDALSHGDTYACAALSRAVFVARTGGVISSLDDENAMPSVLELTRAVLLDTAVSERQEQRVAMLRQALSPARLVELKRRAAGALTNVDLARFVDMHRRAADRFSLLLSGSLVAALVVGPVPGLIDASPDVAASLLRASPRALDLISFAARDNAWLLRRDLGLVAS